MSTRPLARLCPEFFVGYRFPDLELVAETDEDRNVGNTRVIPQSFRQNSPAVRIDFDLLAFPEISRRDFVALWAVDGEVFQNSLNLLDQTSPTGFKCRPVKVRVAKYFFSTFFAEHRSKRRRDRNSPFRVDFIVKPGSKFIHLLIALLGLTRDEDRLLARRYFSNSFHSVTFTPELGTGRRRSLVSP